MSMRIQKGMKVTAEATSLRASRYVLKRVFQQIQREINFTEPGL